MTDATPSAVAGGIVRPAIVYALLFGAVGAYVPYISLFLGSTGLDLGTVGALIALHATVGLVAAPAWGALADGIGDVRGPILASGVLAALCAGLLALAMGPIALALGMGLLSAATAGIIPLVDSRAVRMAGQRDRFGQARAWGSAAFIIIAFAAGAVIGRLGPAGMFVLYAPLFVATGLAGWALLRLPDNAAVGAAGGAARRRPRVGRVAAMALAAFSPTTILAVLRKPLLGGFFVASTLVWLSHSALLGFVSIRISELGGSATIVAATWSMSALVEVPLMYAFPAIARRFGPERLIVFGAVAFALRALVSALAVDPAPIVAASIAGGVGFTFIYLGTVSWVSGAVPRDVQATAQGIFTGTAVSLGTIGGSILGGAIGGAFGLPILFGLSAAGFATGGFLVWVALVRRAAPPARPA